MLAQPESLVAKRAFFAAKQLFVTPHADGQLFPAGDHVVQSEECLGLKKWTQEVRPLAAAAAAAHTQLSAPLHHRLHARINAPQPRSR